MKNTFIRILALAALATSVSSFAATNETGRSEKTASARQENCTSEKQSKKQKETRPESNDQENKDYDRALLGIYG